MVLRKLALYIEENKSLPHTCTKTLSGWNKDKNLKSKTLKILEYMEVWFFLWIQIRKAFLKKDPKSIDHKKIDKFDHVKF